MTAAESICSTFRELGIDISTNRGLVVRGAAIAYGIADPWPSTPFVEVGSDARRVQFLTEIEQAFGVDLNDDDREGILTLGDVLRLIYVRAADPIARVLQ